MALIPAVNALPGYAPAAVRLLGSPEGAGFVSALSAASGYLYSQYQTVATFGKNVDRVNSFLDQFEDWWKSGRSGNAEAPSATVKTSTAGFSKAGPLSRWSNTRWYRRFRRRLPFRRRRYTRRWCRC